MKIGDVVKVKKCHPMPEVVGDSARIVGLQTQEFEKYTVYPVWVKMTSGQHKGKLYGFQYDEVEVLPLAHKEETMKTKVVKQLEELLKGVTTLEDIAEIERVINEVKGKVLTEAALGFWESKTPCWEMFRCPEPVKNECPAYKYHSLPCWQIEGTYCKRLNTEPESSGTDICQVCRVYQKWGQDSPLEIKLSGKGVKVNMPKVLKQLTLP